MELVNVAYVDWSVFEAGKVIRGGALIVDNDTQPLEFRCTDAVRPTQLQKLLWGERLYSNIAANVLGTPLLRSLKQKYGLVLVRNPAFLECRDAVEVPLVLLRRDVDIATAKPEEIGTAGPPPAPPTPDEPEDSVGETIADPLGRFEQIVVTSHPQHKEDREKARACLQGLFRRVDVLEPFERVAKALGFIQEEESRKATKRE
jgi:hypothetical protein